MKEFLEEAMTSVEESVDIESTPKTKKVIENAKEILKDPKFMEHNGVRSIVDQEARVGHKSKTMQFYGYKTEFIITTEQGIITAVRVND